MTDLEQPTLVHGEPSPEDDRTGCVVRTPYKPEFVEELKDTFRHGVRLWNPDEGWWVEEGHESEVEELIVFHYGHVRVVDEAGNERYRDASGEYAQGGLW